MDDPRASVDGAVLRRVVAAEGGVESPYADHRTLVAKTGRLASFLAGVARERGLTGHRAVAEECGVHPARQAAVLSILGRHEARHGRPLLSALVCEADRGTPGEWYVRTVERAQGRLDELPDDRETRRWIWETHREAVYRCWAGGTPSRATGEARSPSL